MLHEAPSAEAIARALGGHREGASWMCRCPVPGHEDKNASLAIREKGGQVLWHCHAKCPQDAVQAALEARGLWPSKPNGHINGSNGHSHANGTGRQQPRTERPAKVVATYPYQDESGRLEFEVVRLEPKGFRQRRLDEKGQWTWNVQGVRQVPYRLPELIEAIASDHPVFVVEGEKDVHALSAIGIVATCNAGGAGKWRGEHAVSLQGADVVILPDNDKAGRDHAEAVAISLQGIARRVRVLELPGLPDKEDVTWWLEKGGGTADKLWELADRAPDWQAKPRQSQLIWGIPPGEDDQRWIIDQMLPEVGIGLLSGQWGTFKTFTGLDLAAAVLTGGTFAGRQIGRRGGVLWLAAEGQGQVPVRLLALATKHEIDINQFAWIKSCPILTDTNAREALIAFCLEAKEQYRARFDLPLSLAIIDTLHAAAGWKDANDTAEAQAVMGMLASVAHEVGICIIAIDHFGKTPDAGTRGASSKEDFSDFVFALLGERDVSGEIRNPHLAVRKSRGGPSGMTFSFTPSTVQLDNGRTSCVIAWQEGVAQQTKTRWPKSLQVFKTALDNTLVTTGERLRPSHDSSEVIAVDIEQVRPEFYKLYLVTKGESEEQKQEARRRAFTRAVDDAQKHQVIGKTNHNGKQMVWSVQERT